MSEKFDIIVVGAGPAGSSAAYILAKAGFNVLMLERGEYPGAKNLFGGVFYSKVLNDLFPNFWEEAPVERYVTKHVTTFLCETDSFSLEFKSKDFSTPPYNGFTVLRSRFDRWFAGKAEEAGAVLMTNTIVDDIIWEKQKAVGVKVRKKEGEVYADLIIIADGINSIIVRKAKLRTDYSPEQVAVGVKELIKLPEEEINKRFGLKGDEGGAYTFVGNATNGIEGGGFLYTNKNSISLGIVCHLSGLLRSKRGPYEIIEDFKSHPSIANLIEGGILKEYSGHLVNEGGFDTMPPLFTDGLLIAGDAATMCVNNGLTIRGVDLAIGSGVAAAETAIKAKEKGDFSKLTLSYYRNVLEEKVVLKDMRTYRHAPSLLRNVRLYDTYPALLCNLAKKLLTIDGSPKKKVWELLNEERKGSVSLLHVLKDLAGGIRSV